MLVESLVDDDVVVVLEQLVLELGLELELVLELLLLVVLQQLDFVVLVDIEHW